MEKDIVDILESKKNKYSKIIIYIFDTHKQLVHFRNKNRHLNKDVILTTIDEIREYKLDGYKIKKYEYMNGDDKNV